MRRCDQCEHYTDGVPDELRKAWNWSNFGIYATGVCGLYFPRGYIGRKPPHPAMATGRCFQWEPKKDGDQLTIEEGTR